jgi:hypothetical protein
MLTSLKDRLTKFFLCPLEVAHKKYTRNFISSSPKCLPSPQRSLLDIVYTDSHALLRELEIGGIACPTRQLRTELARSGGTVYLEFKECLRQLKFLEEQLLMLNELDEDHHLRLVTEPR